MKKIIVASICTIATTLMFDNVSFAQLHSQLAKSGPKMSEIPYSYTTAPAAESQPEYRRNEVNSRAVRNFYRLYPSVSNEKWYCCTDGWVAYFEQDKLNNRTYFDSKGVFQYTTRIIEEDQLPYEIRDRVKSKYYDFNIFVITEVIGKDRTVYFVKLQDSTTWKLLMVTEEEMKTMEDLRKES